LSWLDVIVSDKLIDAILDHDDETPPPPRKPGRPKGGGKLAVAR
jgi:hypothetical protein